MGIGGEGRWGIWMGGVIQRAGWGKDREEEAAGTDREWWYDAVDNMLGVEADRFVAGVR